MLPEYEKQRIKKEIQDSKEDPIQILMIQKIKELTKEIAVLASRDATTLADAIHRIDKAIKWVEPDYKNEVEVIGRLAEKHLKLIALYRNIDERKI
ncbi:hypothetical protein B7729_02995 [Streptococcus oralis subsp. tigurinus]|uniref:Uncharacterized protein n=1 Tax=Streptococcus oralis subsp. tigurinus TaxID=1077464 RepID=A0A1X1G086_STROR|nr:hypothetical protein [Streptococcus oralis]ORO39934.1 hypothetical protein B7729_02995 [Streptococcus oralis subsp. tigurinus]